MLTQETRKDIPKLWISPEFHEKYIKTNVCISSRRTLIAKVNEKLSDMLLILSLPGIANVIIFNREASKMFKMEDGEDTHIQTKRVAKNKLVKRLTYNWTQISMKDALMCLMQNLL